MDFAQILKIGGGVVGFVVGLFKVVPSMYEFITKSSKKVQPKMAMSFLGGSTSNFRMNDNMYSPFSYHNMGGFTQDDMSAMSFDYQLTWNFTLNITNQTDIPAFEVRLLPLDEKVAVTLSITPKIDVTKPFTAHQTESFIVICQREHRSGGVEAAAKTKEYPFHKLRLEYKNKHGVEFATEVFPGKEFPGVLDDASKNVYLRMEAQKSRS